MSRTPYLNSMPRAQTLLLPVKPAFVALTLCVALILQLLPWGRWIGVPDFMALILCFWSLREPRLVSYWLAFALGLIVDVQYAAHFGEHALAYVWLVYLSRLWSRRLLGFKGISQALHVGGLLLVVIAIRALLHLILERTLLSPWYWLDALSGALLWWPLTLLLLLPQQPRNDPEVPRSL